MPLQGEPAYESTELAVVIRGVPSLTPLMSAVITDRRTMMPRVCLICTATTDAGEAPHMASSGREPESGTMPSQHERCDSQHFTS